MKFFPIQEWITASFYAATVPKWTDSNLDKISCMDRKVLDQLRKCAHKSGNGVIF